MGEQVRALLLHDRRDPLRTLRRALDSQGVKTLPACNCAEALRLLQISDPPQLVFTDTQLPDGNWADAIRIARKATEPVNVIVVSPVVDVPLYVEAVQAGAFDFISPPFEEATRFKSVSSRAIASISTESLSTTVSIISL